MSNTSKMAAAYCHPDDFKAFRVDDEHLEWYTDSAHPRGRVTLRNHGIAGYEWNILGERVQRQVWRTELTSSHQMSRGPWPPE